MVARFAGGMAVLTSLAWVAGTGTTAAQISITGARQQRTVECQGRSVLVSGSMNELTLRGACPRIDVTGAGNTIEVEQVGRIEITGPGNRVTWAEAIDGPRPRVSTTGLGNVVTQRPVSADRAEPSTTPPPRPSEPADAAPPASAPARTGQPVVVLDDQVTRTIECERRDVDLRGDGNTLTLRGDCGRLLVTGNQNVIEIESVRAIDTPGNDNRITWTKGPSAAGPKVTNRGNGNTIRRAVK